MTTNQTEERDAEPQRPLGFLLTASELEGVAPTADWSRWIRSGNAPESHDGAGFRTAWRDDLSMLAELGATEIAVTLEWARLWPTPSGADHREIEFRRDLLMAINELGITPWACLVDGTLPGWFADDERGFTDDKTRRLLWPRHVDWVGETFGDLVGGWIPMREPRQWAAWGHLVGATPPGNQRRRDMQKMVRATTEAEIEAARLLVGSAPIASHVTGRTILGEYDNVKAAPHATWLKTHLSQDWLDDLADGAARDAFDRIVVQLRPGISIDAEGAWRPVTDADHVDALLAPLEAVAAAAGDRQVVAAADLSAVGDVDGDAGFEHIAAMRTGAKDMGAHGWWQTSPIDGWAWQHGFSASPGVVDRDRNRRPAATALHLD